MDTKVRDTYDQDTVIQDSNTLKDPFHTGLPHLAGQNPEHGPKKRFFRKDCGLQNTSKILFDSSFIINNLYNYRFFKTVIFCNPFSNLILLSTHSDFHTFIWHRNECSYTFTLKLLTHMYTQRNSVGDKFGSEFPQKIKPQLGHSLLEGTVEESGYVKT